MLKNMKLGTKIASGFVVIMLITAGIAFVGWDNLQVVTDRFFKVDDLDCITQCILQARRSEKNFIIRGDKQYVEDVSKAVEKLKGTATRLKVRVKDPANARQMDTVLASAASYEKVFAEMVAYLGKPGLPQAEKDAKLRDYDNNLRDAGRSVEKECADAKKSHFDRLQSQIAWANTLIVGGTVVAIVLGIIFTFAITRMITRPIHKVIDGLTMGSHQVAVASNEVATSSQSLAEGASEQASAIQETSASLEQLSSMTRKNADNAAQTRTMMGEAKDVVEKANAELNHTVVAVEEISKTSEQIGKIIKTIDEIAFQTNLLALNAAVEAARAGEAGAGFSVVAEEVRNLAIRAAEAAKSTSTLIENSIKSVKRGSELTRSTQDAFAANKDISMRIAVLVDEIDNATREQAQGIEQINKAIVEMDTVIQRNAASAEEAASASQELNAQAEEMKGHVGSLVAVIGGAQGDGLGRKGQADERSMGAGARLSVKKIPGKPLGEGRKRLLLAPRTVHSGEEDFQNF